MSWRDRFASNEDYNAYYRAYREKKRERVREIGRNYMRRKRAKEKHEKDTAT